METYQLLEYTCNYSQTYTSSLNPSADSIKIKDEAKWTNNCETIKNEQMQRAQVLNKIYVKRQSQQQFKYQQMTEEGFSVGEIVWAKITGYPWWPGAVHQVYYPTDDSTPTYVVSFFGENSQYVFLLQVSSTLSSSKVAKYSENRCAFIKKAVNYNLLKQSIDVAENIIQGKSTVEYELAKAKEQIVLSCGSDDSETEIRIESEESNAKELTEKQYSKLFNIGSQSTIETSESVMDEELPPSSLDLQDQIYLEEIERKGIDEGNVIEILQSGILKRVLLAIKEKGERLQRIAKKALIRKYFLKKIPEKPQSLKTQIPKNKDQKKPLRKRPICKVVKPISQIQKSQVETLCVKRIFQILKLFQLDSQSSRTISSNLVLKLKARCGLDTPEFPKQFLVCIQWLKHHGDSADFIKTYYDRLFQESIVQHSKQCEDTAEIGHSPLKC